MKKRELFVISLLTFFMGMVFGFLIAPGKNGFGNNCGNTTNNYYHEPELEDEMTDGE